MPFRKIERPLEPQEEEKSKEKGFRRIEKPQRKLSKIERIAHNVPQQFLAHAVGQGPALAELAARTTPQIEKTEEQARPSWLSPAGLEAAPERGLRNLLTLLGQQDLVKKLTPESITERLREQSGRQNEPQSGLERILQRGAQLGGGAAGLGGGVSSALAQALGGIVGQTGREYGLPEPVATTAEFATGAGVQAAPKKLIPKAGEKKLAEFAAKKGLTEKQITPLLKSPTAQEKLGQHALKTSALKKSIKDIGAKFETNFYEPLKETANKLPKLNESQTQDFLESLVPIQKELSHSRLPTTDKEYAKDQLIKLAERVEQEGISPRDIIDTWQDINKNIQWKKVGSKPYAAVKDALGKTLKKINPELADDFQMTNQLYSKYIPLRNALKPNTIDNILSMGTEGEIAIALAMHNPSLIKHAFGALGTKYIYNQLLTNPRYHNLSRKMLSAVYRQDKPAISRLVKQLNQMLPEEF